MIFKHRIIAFLVFLAVSTFFLSRLSSGTEGAYWYSLLPPLLAVGLAFATHNIFLSLGLAVLIGGPLAKMAAGQGFPEALWNGIILSGQTAVSSLTDWTNIQILIFASFVLIMIGVIQGAGGFQALADYLGKYAKGKRSTKLITFFSGFVVFIDDYASTMVVGSSMRPLSDRVGISREKLAFLVDATSAPIAGLAIVSTWIGYEVGLFQEVSKTLALGQNGYAMFFDALSFRFYCLFMLLFVFLNIMTGIDFGPMKKAESEARPSAAIKSPTQSLPSHYLWIALLPFIALMSYLLVSLWFDGNGPQHFQSALSLFSLGYWRAVLSDSENNILILAKAATVGLGVSMVLAFALAKKPAKDLLSYLHEGGKRALLPVTILVLAWSLKSICTALNTGPFLAAVLGDVIQPSLFPLCLFLVSSLIAISTGTSWGTMAILIPTAIPLAFHLDGEAYGLITMISLGAILDGAIMGDHCSPISDTTILSSMSTECNLMAHVKTQMPYSVIIALIAIVGGYLPAGFGYGWVTSLSLALVMLFGLFWFFRGNRVTD